MNGRPTSAAAEPRPFIVAHRAGNSLVDLYQATAVAGVAVEADLWLRAGRIEVGHARALTPVPIVRASGFATRRSALLLGDLLRALPSETHLVLDLKGRSLRLSLNVLSELDRQPYPRALTVCAQHWPLVEPFRHGAARCMYSIGTRRELRSLLIRRLDAPIEGVSIHERFICGETMAAVRTVACMVMAWTVNCPRRAGELLELGVDGIITDDPTAIARAFNRLREPGWSERL